MSGVPATKGSRVERVQDGLRRDLERGKLRVGAKLVNEQELATRFDVSRLTVREAVASLVTAGYLERRHGSGTYVVGLPRARHALDVTLSYTKMIADAGMKPAIQVLSVETRPATLEEARDLGLDEREDVRSLERLRTADDRPVIYSLDVMPSRLVDEVTDKKFERSLYEVLKKAGRQVVSASAVLLPVTADKHLAAVLDIDVGSALQQITEIDFQRSGEAVLYSTEWHVPGIFELRVNRRP
ncbi:MAG TPA: GntR family transcriptional regulator [Acidimicrobiales bacterium]|nr:GntR family transcriptional regulator [Acidimicrobiales bacterium]